MRRTLLCSVSCIEPTRTKVLKELTLGYLNLEDGMFGQAMLNFKLALQYDKTCADAFWGIVLAKCQIKSEDTLFTEAEKFTHIVQLPEFENAIKFAQETQKKQYENLVEPIRKILTTKND